MGGRPSGTAGPSEKLRRGRGPRRVDRATGQGDGCIAQADATAADGSGAQGIDNAYGYGFGLNGVQPNSPPAVTAVPFIASGELALGVRLHDASALDGPVLVDLGVVARHACTGAPTECAPEIVGDAVAPGQHLAFRSATESRTLTIEAGRLRGAVGDLVVPAALILGPEAVTPTVTLHDVSIDAAMSDEGIDGSLGGTLGLDDVRAAFGISEADAVAFFRVFGDLDPAAEDPSLCRRTSIGMHVRAIAADID